MADYVKGPFLAFHNDPALQSKMLASVASHVKADQVIRGAYVLREQGQFRGCFIGCTIHALDGDDALSFDDVERVWAAYGFPAPLTKIAEKIFEGLPESEAPAFFSAVPNAIKIGADLSLVHWKFLDWVLRDTFAKYATEDVRAGCADALAVIEDLARGIPVTQGRAYAAADAAYAAADAADAARAADAAAYAAAYAAARSTAARSTAAHAARWREFAAKLVEIIKEAS